MEIILKVLAPKRSWRRKKIRELIARILKSRANNFAKNQYNSIRQRYYLNFVSLQLSSEELMVSIVVPCYNTPAKYFEPLLNSVFAQGYANWELVLIDASDNEKSHQYLVEKATHDIRIKYIKTKNQGIAGNTNMGIKFASGDLIAFLDHDDTLDPNALAETVNVFQRDPDIGLVYSDEDKISDDGSIYFQPHFKPDFSLDMLRNVNYITHLVVVKSEITKEIGGIRTGFEGAQDYDFLLRAIDLGIKVGHVPKVLYHWRVATNSTAALFSNKNNVVEAGCKALEEHYHRRNINNINKIIAIKDRPGFYRPKYKNTKDKLSIYLNCSAMNLLPAEKEYIIDCYKKNKDVKKYKIKIMVGLPQKRTNLDLVINGAVIPESKNTDILSLFMAAQERGVKAIAPKVMSGGRLYDMGLIENENGIVPLLKNVNPDKFRSFGSLEWVRNVTTVTSLVAIVNDQETLGRSIIWSHSIFLAFANHERKINNTTNKINFYNPNLTESIEIFEDLNDRVINYVRIDN